MEQEGAEAVEQLESRYHSMTCQAKSVYQLTCATCGHDANLHSMIDQRLPSDAAAPPQQGVIIEGEPCVLSVLQGPCFRKSSADPRSPVVARFARPQGAVFRGTGRRWQGPQGGLWAELDAEAEARPGWVLIEGPGFGIDGPLLDCQRLEPGKEAA